MNLSSKNNQRLEKETQFLYQIRERPRRKRKDEPYNLATTFGVAL
jgi:hypothetical protein